MPSPEEFEQLKLKFVDYVQHDYEVIRPIVLFSERVTERSRQVGIERTVVGDKARRFAQQGMLGLIDQRTDKAGRKGHQYPDPVAAHILHLRQVYPPIHYREIVRIVERKFGYRTNHHTVKSFLDRYPIPVQLELGLTCFHDFEDAYRARWTVVRMHYEGWEKKSIAGCLKLSRQHVHEIIEAFERDGFAGLEDRRSRPVNHPANQLTLPFLKEVLDIQREYPRAGRFRVRGLLEQTTQAEPFGLSRLDRARRDLRTKPPSEATVGRAMAINREFHGAPGPWQSREDDIPPDNTLKQMPYRPSYRHSMWFIDIRYLVKLDGGWIYSICILEGYSRKILAGMATEYQDLTAVLQLLFATLSECGCPGMLISDNGAVFTAQDYQAILAALHIEAKYIEKGKPWQNLIEAQFKVQLRLADGSTELAEVFKFEQAKTLEEIQALHAEFIETFNTTAHWAHQDREDGRRTPVEVLDWVRGRAVDPADLCRVFQQVQFTRTVTRYGYVSIQRFYLYAERGLSRRRVSVWICEGQLHIAYRETSLAWYPCEYDRRQRHLQSVGQPVLHQTSFVSPQLELFQLDDEQWLKVYQRSHQRRKRRLLPAAEQLPLSGLRTSALLLCCLLAEEMGRNFFPHVSTIM